MAIGQRALASRMLAHLRSAGVALCAAFVLAAPATALAGSPQQTVDQATSVLERFRRLRGNDAERGIPAKVMRDARSSGKSATEIAKMTADLDSLRTMYANPLFRLPMTFVEVAPVGLLVAFVSAALLRNPKLLPARG